uniref:Uncharacterized protein n=1 Tax=Candidatus Kentrum sp. MB TaxID=2138164 RepID=A0A450XTS0_9GAMM|nr:MAG: hypothetical protein BECKMB1821G_GA0114241_111910 [Candidatus Kentron sp. MB]VFK35359.1 MAG: hypothetical protein BECKMB1821I_GA0114274_111313 [Candidatus Kentron sp. MB]VFK77245.1 MAG: hypothetical protein BECKMB1821H_GA0114242_111313 [Candidatus Kentron sp. MB]
MNRIIEDCLELLDGVSSSIRLKRGTVVSAEIMQSAYFLGWIHGFVTSNVVWRCMYKFDKPTMGFTIDGVLNSYFGEDADEKIERIESLLSNQNPEFLEGLDKGKVVADVIAGEIPERHPIVNAARKKLREWGHDPDARENTGRFFGVLVKVSLEDYFAPDWHKKSINIE